MKAGVDSPGLIRPCGHVPWVFSPSLQLIATRGTYEMPMATREPRGMLAAGSLRSPPMLKPAMTPERHPDRREG